MRIVKPLAVLCLLALLGLHVWLFFPSHDIERTSDALRIVCVAVFFVFFAMVVSYKRSGGPDPPQWAVNAAGLLFLYGVLWFAVLFIAFKGGSVDEHQGRYFQSTWWGHASDPGNSWEVREQQYRRYTTIHSLAFSAFCGGFAMLTASMPGERSE
jgi:hypothetical protein